MRIILVQEHHGIYSNSSKNLNLFSKNLFSEPQRNFLEFIYFCKILIFQILDSEPIVKIITSSVQNKHGISRNSSKNLFIYSIYICLYICLYFERTNPLFMAGSFHASFFLNIVKVHSL